MKSCATPPARRLSVKTFVNQWDKHLLREACLREVKRGGQVFFLHNKVETIEKMARDLEELMPEAKVAVVIGGQTSTRQAKQRLGRILRRFGNQRAVLYEVVCENTKEVERSRKRRRSDAYERTRHRKL